MDNALPRFSHLPPPSARLPHRPTPRVGQPPSNRNFGNSSAGGSGNGGDGGEAQRNKVEIWGESYVRSSIRGWEGADGVQVVREDSIRNDYSTHYVGTGERPQNHLRGVEVEERFSEYAALASAGPKDADERAGIPNSQHSSRTSTHSSPRPPILSHRPTSQALLPPFFRPSSPRDSM